MKVVAFTGYSGAGKTTLLEQLIPVLRQGGSRVSVVKHAHHRFDIDHPGKDSWRHRQAGAFEVVVANENRLALMREYEQPLRLSVHQMLAELDPRVDWVLIEGYRDSDVPKIEVWRQTGDALASRPLHQPQDRHVVAVATDAPAQLPAVPSCPVLDLNQPQAVAAWLLDNGGRFEYLFTPPP